MTINITELTKLQAIRKEIVQRMIKVKEDNYILIEYYIIRVLLTTFFSCPM